MTIRRRPITAGPRTMAVLLAALLLTACATSPTGRTQLMLVSNREAIAASSEAYVQEVRQLREDDKLSEDRVLIDRVGTITGKLVAQAIDMRPEAASWKWSVLVIDDPETINAWCMAGGRMALYSGLVEQLDATDAELAQVMGHEIAHALADHTAEKMSVAMASSLGVVAVGIATDSEVALTGAAAAAALAVQMPNSRAAEREADRIGIELAAKAGYDPDAAVSLWRKMAAESGPTPPEFLSTHPSPENRRERLAELGAQMEPYYRQPGNRAVYPVEMVTGLD